MSGPDGYEPPPCATCRYYEGPNPAVEVGPYKGMGACHRIAPGREREGFGDQAIPPDYWCGEHSDIEDQRVRYMAEKLQEAVSRAIMYGMGDAFVQQRGHQGGQRVTGWPGQ